MGYSTPVRIAALKDDLVAASFLRHIKAFCWENGIAVRTDLVDISEVEYDDPKAAYLFQADRGHLVLQNLTVDQTGSVYPRWIAGLDCAVRVPRQMPATETRQRMVRMIVGKLFNIPQDTPVQVVVPEVADATSEERSSHHPY